MERATLRTSAILVSTGDRTEWFPSKETLPQSLRQQLENTLNSPNTFTFLLADRNGRRELAHALDGRPSSLSRRYTAKEPLGAPAAVAGKRSPDPGIGIVPMVRRFIIGLSLAFCAVLFLLTARVLSR